jgi:drug/metabolite transporter (DMT)-like permease
MQTIIICILTNTVIGFIFKMFPKYGVNTLQAIVVNYFVCVTMAGLVLGKFPIVSNVHQTEWFPFALFLGFIFIIGFNITALSFQKLGVTLTTIMQKMSLLLTVPVAIWMYNEDINAWKFFGLLAGLVAIYLTNQPNKEDLDKAKNLPKWMIILPIIVWLISVCIETVLQYVEIKILGGMGGVNFVATLFGIAGMIGLVFVIAGFISGRLVFSYKNIVAGIVLGVPNFFAIYLIIVAISEGWEGSKFFPYNNISIIALSAMIAYFLFQEKLSKVNMAGVALAISAIWMISMG